MSHRDPLISDFPLLMLACRIRACHLSTFVVCLYGGHLIDHSPEQATASMQRDIVEGRPSELESQLGVVVRLAQLAGVEVPLHTFLYASLLPQERMARGEIELPT